MVSKWIQSCADCQTLPLTKILLQVQTSTIDPGRGTTSPYRIFSMLRLFSVFRTSPGSQWARCCSTSVKDGLERDVFTVSSSSSEGVRTLIEREVFHKWSLTIDRCNGTPMLHQVPCKFAEANVPASILSSKPSPLGWDGILQDPVFASFFPPAEANSIMSEVLEGSWEKIEAASPSSSQSRQPGRRKKGLPEPDSQHLSSLSHGASISSSQLLSSAAPLISARGLNECSVASGGGIEWPPLASSQNILKSHGRQRLLVIDEHIRGLMHQANIDEDREDSSDGEDDDSEADDDDDDDEEETDLEDLWLINKAAGPKAFSGKAGLVFGYWSKAPYG